MSVQRQAVMHEINHLTSLRKQLRAQEKSLDARLQSMPQPSQFQTGNIKQLKSNLEGFLPQYMMPANIGGLNDVAWPFWFNMNFDATTILPVLSENSTIRQSFQVDQEACFILMSIARSHDTDSSNLSATEDAPLQVDIIDRQSSRRFETGRTPLQQFGYNANPSILPTGMLILPNAFLDCVVSGIPPAGSPQDWSAQGSPTFQLTFFGYRTRIEEAGKVLSTIFG